MKTTTLKPPFGWVGGKSKLAKQIVSLIPEHKLYIEVFGGALNVLYAKEVPKIGKYREIINDFNEELINLHRIIKSRPQSLQMYLKELLISRIIFDEIKLKRLKPRNNIQRAAFFYYQISQSFGSKGNNFAMSAKSRKPKDIYKSFRKWSDRLKFVTIENMDFEKLIKSYDREEAFFYLDPPYVGTESHYKNKKTFDIEDHKRLAFLLKALKGKFLLSYNDCSFVRDMYKKFKIIESSEFEYTLGKNVHKNKKRVSELFITNY